MHLSRAHLLAAFGLSLLIWQVGRVLSYGNVDVGRQALIYLLYDLLEVSVPLVLLDALKHFRDEEKV